MSGDRTREWLEAHVRDTPPELTDEILKLLEAVPAETRCEPARALAAAALAGLDEVARGSGNRREALRLLAADAALTYAFEAAAEVGIVAELSNAVGLDGELGRRLTVEAGNRPGRAGDIE